MSCVNEVCVPDFPTRTRHTLLYSKLSKWAQLSKVVLKNTVVLVTFGIIGLPPKDVNQFTY